VVSRKTPDGDGLFAALPKRSITDRRLTLTDWRVLATVAFFDMRSQPLRTKLGCVKSVRGLASFIGIDPAEVSKSVTRLSKLGYLAQSPHPGHSQRRQLQVIYETGTLVLAEPTVERSPNGSGSETVEPTPNSRTAATDRTDGSRPNRTVERSPNRTVGLGPNATEENLLRPMDTPAHASVERNVSDVGKPKRNHDLRSPMVAAAADLGFAG